MFAPKWLAEADFGFTREAGESLSLEGAELELQRQLTDRGDFWWDAGVRAAYVHNVEEGVADATELKLLLQNTTGMFTTRINLELAHDFGVHGNDTELEARGFVRYNYSEVIRPGIEYQAELGAIDAIPATDEQGHYIGPAVYGELPYLAHLTGSKSDEFEYQFAYLFGLTDASADGDLRWKVEYNFKF